MRVKYPKKFLKPLALVPSTIRPQIEKLVFEELPGLTSLTEQGHLEKMKGYTGFYKIRLGNYRVGLQLDDQVLIVQTVMHRKDIYKYFP